MHGKKLNTVKLNVHECDQIQSDATRRIFYNIYEFQKASRSCQILVTADPSLERKFGDVEGDRSDSMLL
ncbi:hypothetical protein CDL15_Pgr015022 [Punica granatum]|uniref:Uncharacterized protein n=1 Tax=Punica granatum TaxID=22663 RepID=A0A218WZV2_PUNGR|nr:hypothetical protein CDL15_Pgr015022 [Punica granatum]